MVEFPGCGRQGQMSHSVVEKSANGRIGRVCEREISPVEGDRLVTPAFITTEDTGVHRGKRRESRRITGAEAPIRSGPDAALKRRSSTVVPKSLSIFWLSPSLSILSVRRFCSPASLSIFLQGGPRPGPDCLAPWTGFGLCVKHCPSSGGLAALVREAARSRSAGRCRRDLRRETRAPS